MLSFSMIYVIKLLAINRGQCHHHILKRLMDQTVSYLLFSKAPPVVWFVTGPILTWNVLSLTRTGGTLPTGPRAVGIEGAGGLSRPSLILARIEAKPPQIFIPYNGPEGTLQPIGTRGQIIWPKYNQNLHLSISLCPLRFVDLPSALSYRQDHSCSRIHWMFPQTRKREDDSKSVTTLPPHKIHPQRCDIRHWYDFIGQVTETRQKLDWKKSGKLTAATFDKFWMWSSFILPETELFLKNSWNHIEHAEVNLFLADFSHL